MKILRFVAIALVVLVALVAGLFGYFVYAPDPEAPQLTGAVTHGEIEAGGMRRTYFTYAPRDLPPNAPLVFVMHGSGETGARIRRETGYGFDRLADEHGFAVVYPNGYEGYWNGCNVVGDYAANTLNIDDVGFLSALAEKLTREMHLDRTRVFATGLSRGGHMALRLGLEAPSHFRAVAAVAASVPTPGNFKCHPATPNTASLMIMNGTQDPLNPFNGGQVRLFGMIARGEVRSSRDSAQYVAQLNHIAEAPAESARGGAKRVSWRNASPIEVELVAVQGGGHSVPQPYWRAPRVLGPTKQDPNGPTEIWSFFERQRPLASPK